MTGARYRVYARDVYRRNIGEIPDYGQLVLQPRFNDVGGWHLTASASSRAAALLSETGGIIVTRNNLDGNGPSVVFSGLVTHYQIDAQTLEVSGSSDELVLQQKAASPDPSTVGPPGGPPFATEQDLRSGTASTVMLAYVKYNAVTGFAATSLSGRNRAVYGLTLGPDLGLGVTVFGQARWISLLALMQDLALAGGRQLAAGSLRFQVLQSSHNTQTITFTVTAPTDRTATAIISRGRGTLGAWSRTVERPTATAVATLGQGEGVNRAVTIGVDAVATTKWGYEIDAIDDRRDVSDALTLLQANANALIESAEANVVDFTPIDTPALTWGIDYDLGDVVTVATGDGTTLREVVRGVDITLTAPGGSTSQAIVHPIISTPGDVADDPSSRQQRAVTRRVSNLERNVDSLASALSVQWNVGDLRATTRAAAAAGWLLCNGQAVNRLTYSALFGIIGTTYGAGDGSTTFNVPNLRDRFPVGAGLTYALGSTGGAAAVNIQHQHGLGSHVHGLGSHTHTLSHTHDLSTHTHDLSNHTHPLSNHTHTSAAHSHAHSHTSAAHSHSHSHSSSGLTFGGSFTGTASTTGGENTDNGLGNNGGVSTPAVGHTHTYTPAGTVAGNIGGNTASDATSTTPADTGSDATSTTPGATGGPSTNDSGAPSTNTSGTPSNNTSGGASSSTTSAAVGNTDAAAGNTDAALSTTQSVIPPYLAVTWEIYASV